VSTLASSRTYYYLYERRCNLSSSRVTLGNRNTITGASPRQGIIHARPGNLTTARRVVSRVTKASMLNGHGRSVQMRNHIRERSMPGFHLPEEQIISSKQRKAEGFLVTSTPVSCLEIQAATILSQEKVHG
jgi:hypothetical protein